MYPVKQATLYFCVYLTVLMARERCIALRCPVTYHNQTSGVNPWRRAAVLAFPALVVSIALVVPLFFEARLEAVAELVSEVLIEHAKSLFQSANEDSLNKTIHVLHRSHIEKRTTPP